MKLTDLKVNIGDGLWISPTGNIIRVQTNHIGDIINNPSKFGLTDEYIQNIYSKHDEEFGIEGDAREELIKLILQRGWIRIRHYRNYWSVTVFKLTNKTKEHIRNWVYTMIQSNIMGKYEDIKILETSRDKLKTVESSDILNFALEESMKMLNIGILSNEPDLPT